MVHESSAQFFSEAAWPKVENLDICYNVKQAVSNGFLIGGPLGPESLVAAGDRNQLAQNER